MIPVSLALSNIRFHCGPDLKASGTNRIDLGFALSCIGAATELGLA